MRCLYHLERLSSWEVSGRVRFDVSHTVSSDVSLCGQESTNNKRVFRWISQHLFQFGQTSLIPNRWTHYLAFQPGYTHVLLGFALLEVWFLSHLRRIPPTSFKWWDILSLSLSPSLTMMLQNPHWDLKILMMEMRRLRDGGNYAKCNLFHSLFSLTLNNFRSRDEARGNASGKGLPNHTGEQNSLF